MGLNESTSKKSSAKWFNLHVLNGYVAEKTWTWLWCWKLGLDVEIGEKGGGNDYGVGLAREIVSYKLRKDGE